MEATNALSEQNLCDLLHEKSLLTEKGLRLVLNGDPVSLNITGITAIVNAALAAATAPAVAKECFMCHGTGQHAIPLAIPAGIEPPPERMVACQQCKPAVAQQVAASERELFEAWCAGKLPIRMLDGLYVNPDTRTALAAWQARAALDRPAIPDGWQIVPKEPTLKQMAAMGPAIRACFGFDGVNGGVSDVYRAGLAAAPAPGDTP